MHQECVAARRVRAVNSGLGFRTPLRVFGCGAALQLHTFNMVPKRCLQRKHFEQYRGMCVSVAGTLIPVRGTGMALDVLKHLRARAFVGMHSKEDNRQQSVLYGRHTFCCSCAPQMLTPRRRKTASSICCL